jgi:hypothetical protein
MEGVKNKEEKVKIKLCRRHSNCQWVEVSKRDRKDGAKYGNASHWMRRSRMIDQQGRWIEDNSTNGKSHCWMLWSTAREGRKDRLAKAGKSGSS